MEDDKFKEQLDSMIRQAVMDAMEKMGINVSFKDKPNASDLEKMLAKHKRKLVIDDKNYHNDAEDI